MDIFSGKEILPYVGPRPPIGIHRYILVLFRQKSRLGLVDQPPSRANFNTRFFAAQLDLGLPVATVYFNSQKEPASKRRWTLCICIYVGVEWSEVTRKTMKSVSNTCLYINVFLNELCFSSFSLGFVVLGYEEKVLYIIQVFLFFPVNIISWKNKIYVFVFLCVEILMTRESNVYLIMWLDPLLSWREKLRGDKKKKKSLCCGNEELERKPSDSVFIN